MVRCRVTDVFSVVCFICSVSRRVDEGPFRGTAGALRGDT